MAKTNPSKKSTTPKTQAGKSTTPKTKTKTGTTPKTQTKAVVVRRVVKEPPVEYVDVRPRELPKPRGINPWFIAGGVVLFLLILVIPIWPATKIVQKTETIMVPVEKERQEQVTVNEDIKVYTGWLEEEGESVAQTGYYIEYDYWGDPYYVPYTYYTKRQGRTVTIDSVDEIVEFQQSPGPNKTVVITLTSYEGQQTIYRDITSYDLNKVGKANVQVTKTVSTPYTVQEPRQVTNDVEQKIRVSLIKLIVGND